MPFITGVDDILQKIDNRANSILSNGGGDKNLLLSLHDVISDIKQVMDVSTHQELDGYCQKYNGFYRYAHLLEKLADTIDEELVLSPKIGNAWIKGIEDKNQEN